METKRSLSFLSSKFFGELLNFYLGVNPDIEVEDLFFRFSNEEVKKLPELAVCTVNAQNDLVFYQSMNEIGDQKIFFNQSLSSARQARKTGIDTLSLSRQIKEKMEKDNLSKERALQKMNLPWDLNGPVWGGFPIFEEGKVVGGVAVIGVADKHRSQIESMVKVFF